MFSVERDIFINRPVRDVFAFVADPANDAKWQDDVILSEQASDGPLAVEATIRFVQRFMGQEMDINGEIIVYDPPNKICFKSTSGPIEIESCTTCVAQDGGTHLTLNAQGEPGGFFKVAEALVGRQLNKTFESNLKNLKEVMEG